MVAVFEQVLILFIFIALGYALSKLGLVKSEQAKILSSILIYIILPCGNFSTFSSQFTPTYITENYQLLIVAAITVVVLSIVMYFVAKLFAKNKYERGVYEYSLVFANYIYMGYALALGLLGPEGQLNSMVFSIPALIWMYTYSYGRLTKRGVSLKKLINPAIAAIFLGMIVGYFGISVPRVISTAASNASVCMGPLSMLLAGIVMSEFKVKSLLTNPRVYIVTAFRLMIIPVTVGCILKLVGANAAVTAATMIFVSMPCGLNTIVFPRMVDENCEIGASLALVSNVLACITIPIVLTLFGVGAAPIA